MVRVKNMKGGYSRVLLSGRSKYCFGISLVGCFVFAGCSRYSCCCLLWLWLLLLLSLVCCCRCCSSRSTQTLLVMPFF